MQNYSEVIAEALLKTGAFKISLDPLFTWTSGIKSPVYCDLRALISDVEIRRVIVEGFQNTFPELRDHDVIAGTATAGIPWAAWLSEVSGKPMVYVRSAAKEHGTKKRIEGLLRAGARVVLIEDHISTGGSSVSAVEALRAEGQAIVEMIFSINTYELEKASRDFEAAHVKVASLTNFSTILRVAKGLGVIDDEKERLLLEFRKDPERWGK